MPHATECVERSTCCEIGTLYSSSRFILDRVGAPAPPDGQSERPKALEVNFHLCGGFETSHEHNSKRFDATTAILLARGARALQRLHLGRQHYPCQKSSGVQLAALAVDSVFQALQPKSPRLIV